MTNYHTAVDKEWEIPFFLTCALNERDQFLHSPIYGFHGADFMIKLHIRGKERQMHMGLVRTIPSSGSKNVHNNSSIHLHYKIGIKKQDGTEFKCWSEEWTFPSSGCVGRLWECVKLSEIIEEKTLFGHKGALTLFCSFCTKKFETSRIHSKPTLANELGTKRTQHRTNPESYFKRCRQGVRDYLKKQRARSIRNQEKPAKRGIRDFGKLSQNFGELLVTGRGSDVTIKVEDREFLVHKLILSARSPVFDKMFKHDMQEKRQSIVEIKDCTPEAFKEFLQYLYCGESEEFTRNTVFDLYVLSDKYDVQELKSASMEFIAEDLCIDTFCDVLALALLHSDSILLEKATKFFVENNKMITVSAKWLSFMQKDPIQAKEFCMKALLSCK